MNNGHRVVRAFRGEFRFLSNFYPSVLSYRDHVYTTAEHAFQSSKAIDPRDAATIRTAATPLQAKRLGRRVKIRPDWDDIRIDVMREIVTAKFERHADLHVSLIQTGDAVLIEGNHWGDNFWGVPQGGRGQNQLGKILMDVRARLQQRDMESIDTR